MPRVARMEISLPDIQALFHALDPSPFRQRDLAPEAEEFLIGWAEELPRKAPLELTLHLDQADDASAAMISTAIRNHFEDQARLARRDLRQLLRHGQFSLAIGLSFMAVCLFGSDALAQHFTHPLTEIFRESLSVGGWVAMWHPIQIYLYDWWPIYSRIRLLQRMSRMRIQLRCSATEQQGTVDESHFV